MKAWLTYAFDDLRLEEVPYPKPKPGWVTIRVEVVQAAMSDCLRAKGIDTFGTDKVRKVLAARAPAQLFGHEFSGRVVELGEGVTAFSVGDRVTARSRIPCGQCPLCLEGRDELCPHFTSVGRDIPAALAEYVTLPISALARVPEVMTAAEAACMQPFASSVSDINSVGIPVGGSVALVGQGAMGLYNLQVSRVCGAGETFAFDVRPESLELSGKFGADHVVNSEAVDPVEYVREKTGGRGVDIVFECAGGSEADGLAGLKTLDQALRMARIGGTVVQVAHPPLEKPVPINMKLLKSKSIHYVFPRKTSLPDLRFAIQLVASKRVDVASLITHSLDGLEQLPLAMEITTNKKKYRANNPAQLVVWRS